MLNGMIDADVDSYVLHTQQVTLESLLVFEINLLISLSLSHQMDNSNDPDRLLQLPDSASWRR